MCFQYRCASRRLLLENWASGEWGCIKASGASRRDEGGSSEWGYGESAPIGKSRINFCLYKNTISRTAQKYLASQLASAA